MASRNTLDMTEGPILKKLLIFAFPLMINVLINTLYGTVDKIIAGRYINDAAMAAVGASTPTLNMIINFFVALGVGIGVVCGGHLGARRQQPLRECMHTVPLTGLLCGFAVCIVGLLSTKPLLLLTNVPSDVFQGASSYMTVRILGTPVFLTSTFCGSILTCHGDTKRLTMIGILSGLFNVVGNLIFVLVFHMGVEALALATVLSQLIALVMKLWILFSPKDAYAMRFSQLRLEWKYIREIFSIGLPKGFHSILVTASNVIIQSGINSLGTEILAGNSAADSVMQYVFIFPAQMSAACACASAQCYGAQKYERIRHVVKLTLLTNVILVTAANIPMTLFSMPILRLFTSSDAVAAAGIDNLLISIWGYILSLAGTVFTNALQGMRKTLWPALISTVSVCIPRLLWVYVVFHIFKTPAALYSVYPVSWTLTTLLVGIVYFKTIKQYR